MPSSVRVKVVGARDLPEMDRTVRGEFCTDAYVDIKFRNYEQVKKQQCRGFHPDVVLYIFSDAITVFCPGLGKSWARSYSKQRAQQ